jgi:2-polyprenyl-3-methyl-5-hydroxy-6-metoxy-1,4-benzoquinol methylase
MDLEKSYSNVYANEPLGNVELRIGTWPKDRFEASVFFAGTGNSVLDVGCGNGIVLYNLRDKFRELHGIELSKERVDTAKRSLQGLNATVVQGNIEVGIDYDDEYFDAVICSDVLEHLVDVFSGFREMTRVVKKGGRLLINTPNVASLYRRGELLLGRFPSTSASNEGFDTQSESELLDGGHLHYFTFSMLEKLYRQFGYSRIERFGFGDRGRFHNTFPSLLSPSCQIVGTK